MPLRDRRELLTQTWKSQSARWTLTFHFFFSIYSHFVPFFPYEFLAIFASAFSLEDCDPKVLTSPTSAVLSAFLPAKALASSFSSRVLYDEYIVHTVHMDGMEHNTNTFRAFHTLQPDLCMKWETVGSACRDEGIFRTASFLGFDFFLPCFFLISLSNSGSFISSLLHRRVSLSERHCERRVCCPLFSMRRQRHVWLPSKIFTESLFLLLLLLPSPQTYTSSLSLSAFHFTHFKINTAAQSSKSH